MEHGLGVLRFSVFGARVMGSSTNLERELVILVLRDPGK